MAVVWLDSTELVKQVSAWTYDRSQQNLGVRWRRRAVSDNRLTELNRRYREEMERRFSSKPAYALFGALGGITLGVLALVNDLFPGPRGAILLGAGALFGAIVGLDLHSTRGWRHFGKLTFALRFVLACSAGGTATGLTEILLGIVARSELWKYSVGGAILGGLLLLWAALENIR